MCARYVSDVYRLGTLDWLGVLADLPQLTARFDTWLSLAREFNDPDHDLVRRASVLVDYALSGNSLPDTRLTLEIIAEEEIGRYDNASVLLDGWSSALPDGTNIIASTPDDAFGEFEEFFSSQLAEEDLTFDRDGM